MARAATRLDLISAATGQYDKLQNLIDSMTEDEQTATFNYSADFNKKEAHWERDKNLRDILIHLYEWHQLLLNCVNSNQNGETKPFLPEQYNWKTYGQMNVGFWEKHQSTPYEDSRENFIDSHRNVMDMIEGFSNEELFERNHFAWTGTSTLGAYCVSATSSHYDWAMKKIKQNIKANKGTK